MKRLLSNFIVLISIAGLIIFTGCPDDDNIKPSIYFDQAQDTTILLYSVFEDPFVLVEDNKDLAEDIEVTSDFEDEMSLLSTGAVRRVGDYEITYTATDQAGNTSEAVRTVRVANPAEIAEGSYSVQGDYQDINDTSFRARISVDRGEAGRIIFSKSYVHDYEGNGVYLKAEGLLFSPDHSPDMTNATLDPDEYVGWLGTPADPSTAFYVQDSLYHYEAMDSMPRYDYIHLPTIYKADSVSGIDHKIVGRKDDNDYPRSKIYYNGDFVTKIELYYTVSVVGETGAEKVEETFIPY
ncbi:MAG: DUF5011 domain-containing protein [Bacteroidales bacterium]